MRIVLSFLCVLLLCNHAWAEPIVLTDAPQPITIGQGVEYLIGHPDASAAELATLPASAWQTNPRKTVALGTLHQGVWLRFTLHNASTYSQGWHLTVKWPILDEVRLQQYSPSNGKWSPLQTAGDHFPPETGLHRYLHFPLQLAEGQNSQIYLQVLSSESLIAPIQIAHQRYSARNELEVDALLLIFIGGMLVMLLYSISLMIFTRETNYLWYALYLLCTLGYQLAVSGLGHQYLWGHWQWFAPKAYAFFASATFLMALVFGRFFLQLKRYKGWLLGSNTVLIGYWLILIFGVLLYPKLVFWMLPNLMPIVTCIVAFSTVIYLWYRGNASAKVFALAWSVLTISTVIHLLAIAGVFELNLLTTTSQMLGVFLEFVLLSVALAAYLNRERSQRLTAQYNLLLSSRNLALAREEKLQAQQRLLELQQAANQELESRVLKRTEDLEKAKQALEKANAELATLSTTDPLTKLYNRRHFDAVISEEVSRSQRTHTPLSLMMLDIDHFKQVNDNYGHPFGDECLRQVAGIIHDNSKRAGDIAARFGGEEFILALPATDLEQALIVAERIRSKTEALTIVHQGQPVRVTISIGLASIHLERNMGIEGLISAADAALYQAKRNGRNQVVAHQ